MSRRVILALSAFVYLLILACVLVPGNASDSNCPYVAHAGSTNTAFTGGPYRGCAIQITRVDWMDQYKTCIDKIADVGADTVEFVVPTRQENGTSSHVYLDMRMTPTGDQLGGLIDHAKEKKLRVVLMPIVLLDDPQGNEWRGNMHPAHWDTWFDSYRDMMRHFAYVAQSHHVDVMSVGSELVTSEDNLEEWTHTIDTVREIFKGQLTYSSNWDHYDSVPFWNQLDLFSMNSYWKLGKNHSVPLAEIESNWRDIQKQVVGFSQKIHKPLMFTEVGWCSMANAANEPWDYTKPEAEVPTDYDLQKRLYQGFFNVWQGNPNLGGFNIWEWAPGDGGNGDSDQKRGYTPENKPAEQLLREYFAKPWTSSN